MKEEAAIKSYGENAKYGVIIVNTKKYQEELDNEPKQPNVFDVVEGMPQFPGGAAALMQYLSQNIRYPKEAMEAKTQGRVIVQFVVEKDGSISGAHVVKSVNPQLDAEALRVVSAMPNWTPGTQNGQTVRVKYAVPISFRLKADGSADDAVKVNGTARYHATATWKPADDATEFHGVATRAEDKANVSIFIDNKEVKSKETEMAGVINIPEDVVSDQIKSMAVDKSDPKQVKIHITTKK